MPIFEQIVDHENLLKQFKELKRGGGPAPGLDGIRYDEIGPSDAAVNARVFSRALKDGNYRPQPSRIQRLLRSDNSVARELRLRVIFDRVIDAALADFLKPLVDPILVPTSYAYRDGYGALKMLADMDAAIICGQRFVIAQDDVHHAFDNVRIADVLRDLEPLVQCSRTLNLIERVIRGSEQSERYHREVGLDQGGSMSPRLFNLRLHHALDRPLAEAFPEPVLLRYSDNLAFVCRTVEEGSAAINRCACLLQQNGNLALKRNDDDHPRDIRGAAAKLLGFRIDFHNNAVRYRLDEAIRDELRLRFNELHQSPNPPAVATMSVEGSLACMGPIAIEDVDDAIEMILQTASDCGFREIASRARLTALWQGANEKWLNLRRKAAERRSSSIVVTGGN